MPKFDTRGLQIYVAPSRRPRLPDDHFAMKPPQLARWTVFAIVAATNVLLWWAFWYRGRH